MIHTSKGDYSLRYDYNALCEYEKKFDRSLLPDISKAGFSVIRGLVWAGLLHAQKSPYMTEKEVGDLIEDAVSEGMDIIAIRKEISDALNNSTFIKRLAGLTQERAENATSR